MGQKKPRVGLVNLGVEESKGTSVIKDAYKKLKKAPINFIGNVEAREVPAGACEVIVCDGFVGNVILKLTEESGDKYTGTCKEQAYAEFQEQDGCSDAEASAEIPQKRI